MLTQNTRLFWKGQAWTMLSECLSKYTQKKFQKQLKKEIKGTRRHYFLAVYFGP